MTHRRSRSALSLRALLSGVGALGLIGALMVATALEPAPEDGGEKGVLRTTLTALATDIDETRATTVEREAAELQASAEEVAVGVQAEKRQIERQVAAEAERRAATKKKAAREKADEESGEQGPSDGSGPGAADDPDSPSGSGGSGAPATADPEQPASPSGSAAPGDEGAVIDIVNVERGKAGCGPVRHDEGLARVARAHSADMAARGYFDHDNPDGQSPFDRADAAGVSAAAENISAGQNSPQAVMAGWMKSDGHRANILNCGLTRLGVGRATGGSYGIYWTQLFGR